MVMAVLAGATLASQPIVGTPVKIEGAVYEVNDVSAVVAVGSFLVIASDEGSSVQVLEEAKRGVSYRALAPVNLAGEEIVRLAENDEVELDLEGLAVHGTTVYAVGSHSRVRSRVTRNDEGKTPRQNRDRIATVQPRSNNNWLFRMSLDEHGEIDAHAVTRTTLRDTIVRDPILDLFWAIPGKENGIDLEGITMLKTTLYVGLRSPVLRENWVPVLTLDFDESPQHAGTRFVNLDGLGVRGMETVEDGVLLLAGPPGDANGTFRVYLWNGGDMLPGTTGPDATLSCLGEIRPLPEAKAEGLARIGTAAASWDVLIVFDGVDSSDRVLGRFQIPRRPRAAACD